LFSRPYRSLALWLLLSCTACAAVMASTQTSQIPAAQTSWLAVSAIALPLVIRLVIELKHTAKIQAQLDSCSKMLERLIEQHREPFTVAHVEDMLEANARRTVAIMDKLQVKDTEVRS